MIELYITEDQRERARKLYHFYDIKDSITKGRSQMYGALGEIVVKDWFGKDRVTDKSSRNYDLLVDGLKVDVKTKRTAVRPQPHYLCSIAKPNSHQKCDYYMFVRVKGDMKTAYLLGYISKEEFFEKAVFKKKGETDGKDFVFKDNCYNLEVRYLHKFKPKNYE